MKKNRKFIIEITLFILLVFITVLFVFKDIEFKQIFDVISESNPLYILCAGICMVLFLFFDGYCIKVIFSEMNQKMSIIKCIKYAFVEFFFSGLTPSSTGGQPMQAISMSRDGYKTTDSTVALMLIALIYRMTLLFFTVLMFIFNFSVTTKYVSEVKHIFIIGLILNVLFALLLTVFLFSKKIIFSIFKISVRIAGIFSKKIRNDYESYFKKAEGYIEKYHNCASFMFSHARLVLKTTLILSVQRLCILSVTYFVYKALGLSGLSFLEVICIQIILSICVDILPFPGSVGISETVFLLLYGSVFGSMVYPAVVLSRGISFYAPFIVSALGVFASNIFRMAKKEK